MNNLTRAIAYCFLVLPNLLVMTASQNLFGSSSAEFLLFVVLYTAVLFAVILVHEGGHALAALAFGWRVTLFAVFPFAYRAKANKMELWVLPSGDLGGAVAVSSGKKKKTRIQSALFAAAGPLANILLAAAMLRSVYLFPRAQDVLGSIAITFFFVGLGNLLPWRSREGIRSDGAAIAASLTAKIQ